MKSHPWLRVHTAGPLLADSDEDLLAALDARLGEAIGRTSAACAGGPDGLVMLAAGSSDDAARARIAGLADAWGRARGLPAEVAFCDLTSQDRWV